MSEPTKECVCPVRPEPSRAGAYTRDGVEEAARKWDEEHGGHSWARERRLLMLEIGPRIDRLMDGKGHREWAMLAQFIAALCLLLLALPARSAPNPQALAQMVRYGLAGLDQMRRENTDLVNGAWSKADIDCAVTLVTLRLVDLALAGDNMFPFPVSREDLGYAKAGLEAQKPRSCGSPPGGGVNAGAEFVRAVEVRNAPYLQRVRAWLESEAGKASLRMMDHVAAVLTGEVLLEALPAAAGAAALVR